MSNNSNVVHLGIVFPKDTVKRIDERKGKYYSRNKFLLKIVEEHLDEDENDDSQKGLQGPEFESPAQAEEVVVAATSKTPAPTSDASSVMNTTNDEGGSRRDSDAN